MAGPGPQSSPGGQRGGPIRAWRPSSVPDPAGKSPDRRHKARWWRHLSQFETPIGSDGPGGARAAGAEPGPPERNPGRGGARGAGPPPGCGRPVIGSVPSTTSPAGAPTPARIRATSAVLRLPAESRRSGRRSCAADKPHGAPGSLHGTLEFVTYSATSRLMVGPKRAGWSAHCLASSARARGQPTTAECWVDSTFNRP